MRHTHAGREANGTVAHQVSATHKLGRRVSGTHRLANRPMQKLARAEMDAVAVTASRLMPWRQRRYASSLLQMGSASVPGQTQVPPESATMDALTAMMYAMAKKVARPARISVKKYEPLRSRGCGRKSVAPLGWAVCSTEHAYMAAAVEAEPAPDRAGRDLDVDCMDDAHCGCFDVRGPGCWQVGLWRWARATTPAFAATTSMRLDAVARPSLLYKGPRATVNGIVDGSEARSARRKEKKS